MLIVSSINVQVYTLVHHIPLLLYCIEIKDENLIPSFGPDVLLECIVPTTTGAGVCVTALLDFLVRTHNNFLMDCKTKEQGELRYVGHPEYK